MDTATGQRVEPAKPNTVKLEAFIFDAIPLAGQPMVLQTVRAEEFSPVKNATGVDSADTSRRDMNRRAAGWLDSAGFDVPRKAGEPDGSYEISPLLALDGPHLREVMTPRPRSSRGQKLLRMESSRHRTRAQHPPVNQHEARQPVRRRETMDTRLRFVRVPSTLLVLSTDSGNHIRLLWTMASDPTS